MMEIKEGKILSVRTFWLVQSEIAKDNYSMCEWKTRRLARRHMKICKESLWYDSVHMYKVTEIAFGGGESFVTKKKVR